jgi:hypothetical protein
MKFSAILLSLVSPLQAAEYVALNATNIVSEASRKPIGINLDYLMDSDRRRPDAPRSTEAALREMGVRFLRYPGGEKSDTYLWSVPPWTGPRPTLARTGPSEWPANDGTLAASNDGTWIPGKEPLDFDEFMTLSRNLGGEPVIVVCYDSMYKSATAGGTRPTRQQLIDTATEWVRYANVTKGYNVKYWSIGNETDYNADGNPGSTQYANDVIAFSDAMKAVDPTIRIGAQGQTAGWFQNVLNRAAAKIDFLDVHEYAGADWKGNYEIFRNNYQYFANNAAMAISTINSHAGVHKDRIKVIVSEMGPHSFKGTWDGGNDIGHCIVFHEQIGQHLRLPKVECVQYWNTRWVDNEIYQLPVGTTNLLSNGSFENGFDDWPVDSDTTPGNTSLTTLPAEVRDGGTALKIAGATAGGRRRDITQLVPPNRVFTLSAWAKTSSTEGWSGGGISFYKNGSRIRNLQWDFKGSAFDQYVRRFRSGPDYDRVELWVSKNAGSSVLCADDFQLVTGGRPGPLTSLSADNELFGTGRVLAIWGTYLQQNILSTATTPNILVHASHTPSTNRCAAFLTNKSLEPRDASLDLKNYTAPAFAKRKVFKGTTPTDHNPTWEDADDCPVTENNRINVTLPPLSITILDLRHSFATWSAGHFSAEQLANPGVSDPTADPDGDGAPNLFEYARGTDPLVSETPSVSNGLIPECVGGELSLTYEKDANRADLTVTVERSDTLGTWTTEGVTDLLVSENETRQIRRAVTAATAERRFLRIKVREN